MLLIICFFDLLSSRAHICFEERSCDRLKRKLKSPETCDYVAFLSTSEDFIIPVSVILHSVEQFDKGALVVLNLLLLFGIFLKFSTIRSISIVFHPLRILNFILVPDSLKSFFFSCSIVILYAVNNFLSI